MFTIEYLEKLRSSQLMNGFAGVDGFTPLNLVIEQFDKIPLEWSNPNLKFFIPAAGHGTYGIVGYWRLMEGLKQVFINENERSRHILKNMLYLNEINPWLCRQLRIQGFINVIEGDYLEYKTEMKFDVIIGNPPYQEKVGPRKTEPIWDKFVFKGFDLLNKNGFLMLIHPSGWRNVDGRFKKVQELLKSKKLTYLEMHSEKDGMRTFGASIMFDLYVVQNKDNDGQLTTIKTFDGDIELKDLSKMDFIPNSNFDKVLSLIAENNENTVDVIHSYSNYETRKSWMSKVQNDEYVYPCVCNVAKSEDCTLMYSNTNQNGHFGISKLICGNASSGTNYFIDGDGEFGLTQFSFAIVENLNKLERLKMALKSEKFQNLIKSIPNNSSALNFKILSTFRKNFWEEFIDE